MKFNTWKIAVLSIMGTLVVSAPFSPCIGQKKSKTPVASTRRFDNLPFVSRAFLPPYYEGHDIVSIFEGFKRNVGIPRKREYETTSEFNLRLANLGSIPIPGGLTAGSVFAFRVRDASTIYDADSRLLRVYLPLNPVFADDAGTYDRAMSIRYMESSPSIYVATNAFGVKRRIKFTRRLHYNLAVGGLGGYWIGKGPDGLFDGLRIPLQIERNTAIDLRKRLRVLVVCRAKQSSTFDHVAVREPTITDPEEIEFTYRYLNVQIDELVIYDEISGQIYWKGRGDLATFADTLSLDVRSLEEEIRSLRLLSASARSRLNDEMTRLDPMFGEKMTTPTGRAEFDEWSAARDFVRSGRTYQSPQLMKVLSEVPSGVLSRVLRRASQALTDVVTYKQHAGDKVRQDEISAAYASYKLEPQVYQDEIEERFYLAAIRNTNRAKQIWNLVNEDGFKYALAPTQVATPTAVQPPPQGIQHGGILTTKAISMPKAAYPQVAKNAGVGGEVKVKVTINREGRVVSAEIVEGHAMLHHAVLTAARGARFSHSIPLQTETVTQIITYSFVP